jgi:hypothetical protein
VVHAGQDLRRQVGAAVIVRERRDMGRRAGRERLLDLRAHLAAKRVLAIGPSVVSGSSGLPSL